MFLCRRPAYNCEVGVDYNNVFSFLGTMRQGSVRPAVDHQWSNHPLSVRRPATQGRWPRLYRFSGRSGINLVKSCSRGSSLLWFGSPSVNSIEYLRAGSRTSSLLRSDKAVGPEENNYRNCTQESSRENLFIMEQPHKSSWLYGDPT